jgi:hypothetical protein
MEVDSIHTNISELSLMLAIVLAAAVCGTFISSAVEAEPLASVERKGVSVTVFNTDLAMVKDIRTLTDLPKGTSTLDITGIPSAIKPDSIRFKDLLDPDGTAVIEQNYEFDLAGAARILEKYKASGPDDKAEKISVMLKDGSVVSGALLYFTRGTMGLRIGDGSVRDVTLDEARAVRAGELPKGLRTKPTLVWKLKAEKKGTRDVELSYLTGGMGWRSDYRVTLDGSEKLSLSAWVTITNYSGVTYPDATIKLMAGDVHMAEPTIEACQEVFNGANKNLKATGAPGFKEKSFAEYHLYTLQRKSTLAANQTKQIKMFPDIKGIKWTKKYEYNSGRHRTRVLALAVFKNEKKNNLGMPLPKGRVRIFALDTGGEPELAGEDAIDHTPKDEEVKLRLGYAFDVVVERKVLAQSRPRRGRPGIQQIELKLRNHKDTDVTVDMFERLRRGYTAKVTKTTHKHKKKDAYTLHFPVEVKANTEAVLRYKVKYTSR